jgi:hypothetical protein
MAGPRLAIPLDRVRTTGLTWCHHPSGDLSHPGPGQFPIGAAAQPAYHGATIGFTERNTGTRPGPPSLIRTPTRRECARCLPAYRPLSVAAVPYRADATGGIGGLEERSPGPDAPGRAGIAGASVDRPIPVAAPAASRWLRWPRVRVQRLRLVSPVIQVQVRRSRPAGDLTVIRSGVHDPGRHAGNGRSAAAISVPVRVPADLGQIPGGPAFRPPASA